MTSPFLLASCGCIVLPLYRKSEGLDEHEDAICIRSCDADPHDRSSWLFHVRPFEIHKIRDVDSTRALRYYKNNRRPRSLDKDEENRLIQSIGLLMSLGDQARELSGILSNIELHAQDRGLVCGPLKEDQ